MSTPSIDPATLRPWLDARMPATLDLLHRLVDVNSFTANRAGVVENGRLVAQAFEPLGFRTQAIRSADDRYGDHLFLERPGPASAPTVVLVSHLDTVYPLEEERANDFHWRIEGDRVYGPGVNDIKGGTAMMWLVLSALQRWAPASFEATRWLLAFNASEETDSTQFGELAHDRMNATSSSVAAVLVFEAAHPLDERTTTLVTRRKGRLAARIECRGRGAHSGVSHPEGANAVVELCRVMASLAERTDYGREVTWNPAAVLGGIPGEVTNRVPHHAAGDLEVRAFEPNQLAEARAALLALEGDGDVRAASDGFACRREISITGIDPPWPGCDATQRLFDRWRQAAERIGRRVVAQSRGGLSDANHVWRPGTPVLDGLGPAGLNAHCSQRSADGSKVPEWMDLSSFTALAATHVLAIADVLATP